jgi:opacity protein-like surface antigen
MKKLTDQELDSVFKNAAEGYEPAFDSSAWDALNTKLNEPKASIWKRWMSFALLGLIIFFAGVWVGTYLNEGPSMAHPLSELKDKELIQDEKSTITKNPDSTQSETNQIAGQKETIVKKSRDNVTARMGLSRRDAKNQEVENKISIIISDSTNPVEEAKFILQGEKKTNELNTIVAGHLMDSAIQEIVDAKIDSTQSKSEENVEKQLNNSHGIFLRFQISPDFSSIKNTSSLSTATGVNYSLLIEYQLMNHWSVSTGGIWSMKKYSVNEEVKYGKYTADSMVGTCRILDIPVNVNYHFRPQSRASFYAGIGLSSYIMLEEDYTYTVNSSSGSRDYSYYIERENNEWFKILNVSAGIQYQIAPRVHLQAEPFLKAPLVGIGEWDVLLSSMGIFMGLKYKIN